jgi:TRAP transporter TAXI family solute receptor
MHESTAKKLRLVPVVLALLLTIVVSWFLLRTKRTELVFSTGSQIGLYHRLGESLKAVVEAAHPDISIELKNSAGSSENIVRLNHGQAQLAMVQNDAKGGTTVRSIAAMYPEVLHLLCRSDANIRSLGDLSGRRIGVGAIGSGTEQLTAALLDFVGVTPQADQAWRGSFSEAIEKLRSGDIDAAFVLTGVGAEVVEIAMRNKDIVLVPIQMEATSGADPMSIATTFTDGFRVHYPHIAPQTIPMMAYDGRPITPVPAISVQAVLVCEDGIDAEIIARITRTLFEQRAVLSQREPAFNQLDEQAAQSHLQFPLHEGAIHHFHRMEPGFLSQNAEAMGFLVTLMLLSWSVLAWARRWYLQRRKNRVDKYYKEIAALSLQLPGISTLEKLDELESELHQIGRIAVGELVDEHLAADESFVIYQTLFNDCQSLMERSRVQIQGASRDQA